MFRHEFAALGTRWAIGTPTALSAGDTAEIARIVEDFDRTYSRFRTDSVVGALATTAGAYHFPREDQPMFDLYRQLYDLTDGRFTPLVGRALEHAGYDRKYSLEPRPGRVIIPRWDEVMAVTGTDVSVTAPVVLDFGAAGKGRLVDLIAALLGERGYTEVMVDGSGDLVCRGSESVLVGLENPFDPHQVIGVVGVANAALAGSASNRRRWSPNQHHLLNGRTGECVDDVVATWVLAENAMLADGLATAVFVCDPDVLATQFSFAFVRVLGDGSAQYSTNFPGELFS